MAFGAPVRWLVALAVIVTASAATLAAQSHVTDISRFSIGAAIGEHGGTTLRLVPAQTISAGIDPSTIDVKHPQGLPYPTSDFSLRRAITAGLMFNAHFNLALNNRFGLTGELTYLGLTGEEQCSVARDGGVAFLRQACAAVGSDETRADHSGAAFLTQLGVVFHPFAGAQVQPYVMAAAGVANTPTNSAAMQTAYTDPDPTVGRVGMVIYPDAGWNSLRPVVTAGFGIRTAPINRVQFYAEYRISWLSQLAVTDSTPVQNTVPPTASVRKGIQTILVGFDIVLKGEHGKRY